ncbi:Methyltransferase-like 26 [Nibea albiflora]|uniref:Methyltransferase-like 26 n=1 Tax=Nibea albiflora TaxID=240163 RepID=A0ACB7FLW5_NIBAL|nr:Methyltransferase-like 26 [Nibea albiflora]
MLNAAAAERNKEPILAVLRESVNTGRPLQALEISSEAYRAHYQLHNVKPAIHLDASLPPQYWGGIQPESLDLVVNINMIHISPFACTEKDCAVFFQRVHNPTTRDVIIVPKDTAVFFQGLFKGAGIVLKPQGLLLTYGEPGMGTQGYLPPQFYRTEKWLIPGEDDRHASKQQVSSVQEGEFGVKHPVVPEQDGQTP